MEQKMNRIDGLSERMAVLESKAGAVDHMASSLANIEQTNLSDDKRITALETSTQTMQGRWQKITSFILQLVWAVVACYVIYKLGLSDSMPP
jgi:hypothetical protein